MPSPRAAVEQLLARLQRLLDLRLENSRIRALRAQPYEQISPHLLRNRTSLATSYVLLSKTGRALLLDYGYDFCPGLAAGTDRASRRPWLYTLPALRRDHGVDRIDAVLPTHYHDDHVAGCNLLRASQGVQVWAAENFADVLEEPHRYDLPCLWYDPIKVDRRLPLGTPIRWHEYELTLHEQPGHTAYGAAISFEVDGRRVLAIGDHLGGPGGSQLNYVYSGGFGKGDYRRSAAVFRRLRPDLLLTGHSEPLQPAEQWLESVWAPAAELELLHRELLGTDELDLEGSGPVAAVHPYRPELAPGESIDLEVVVRNPHPHPAEMRVRLVLPAGFGAWPEEAALLLQAGARGSLRFCLTAATKPVARARLGVDITAGALRLGELAEALVTVG